MSSRSFAPSGLGFSDLYERSGYASSRSVREIRLPSLSYAAR